MLRCLLQPSRSFDPAEKRGGPGLDGETRDALYSTQKFYTSQLNTILDNMPADQLTRTFAALADPTRRAILARLAQGGATVGQLAEPFAMSFAAVSKHLRVLEAAELVSRGRNAQYRPATLDARPLANACAWIGDYAKFWGASFDALGDVLAEITTTETSMTDKGETS